MDKLDIFKRGIAEAFAVASGVTPEQAYEVLEEAPLEKADFCAAVGKFNRFTKLKGSPVEFAKTWAAQCPVNEILESVWADGPYVNFKVHRKAYVQTVLAAVAAAGEKYGQSPLGAGKKIIVEFSSPNIAKPFHAGHLRSTILGQFLVNVHRFFGYDVTSINYLGDWGKQYGLLAVGFELFGDEAELQRNPIRHLFDVYVKINARATQDEEALSKDPNALEGKLSINDQARAYFRRMETGDETALAMWRKFRDLSINEYRKLYARLNVSFDVYSGESLYGEEMVDALKHLEEKKLVSEDRGARLVKFEDFGAKNLGKVLVQKSDGATLYITRDIAAAKSRFDEYHFDQMFYVVAAQQDMHFKQLFKILELAEYDFSKRCTHVNFGMVKGMKTRTGQVVFLEEILDKARAKMLKKMAENEDKLKEIENPEDVADKLGLSAVLIQDFSARRIKDYEFDWKTMLAAEGDTGPYLQYTHARLASITRKAEEAGVSACSGEALTGLETNEAAWRLVQLIARYESNVLGAMRAIEACSLVTYLMQLARCISSVLSVLRVIGEEPAIAQRNLALYQAALVTLKSGLRVIGINPLDRI